MFSKKHTPILTTFHGSDINSKVINIFSTIAIKYSTHSIFVSQSLYDKAWLRPKKNYSIIPCGVSGDIFVPMDKFKARKILGFKKDTNYILFPSRISNPVKNYPLAKKALDLLDFKFELIELMKKTREEVNLIMNACDLLILTSKSEGSPQVIKEALFTNLPIVSVDVGDVSENIKNVTNCFVASNNPKDLSIKIKKIISNKNRTNGSSVVNKFYNNEIAEEIKGIYNSILKIDEVKK